MQRIRVTPRTREWLDMRDDAWTASTAAILVVEENAKLMQKEASSRGINLDIEPLLKIGITDYFDETPWSSWAEKTGRIARFKGNDHTERGQRFEPTALQYFERRALMLVEPDVTVHASGKPWLFASLDGLAPASSDLSVHAPYGFPVEAKVPAFQSRRKLALSKREGKPAIMGLPYYWCQVQHQILVTEAPYGWFVAIGVEVSEAGEVKVVYPVVEKVLRDDAFLAAYEPMARFFYETYIYDCVEPPKLPSDELRVKEMARRAAFDRAVATGALGEAVDLFLAAREELKAAQRRAEEFEEKAIALAATQRKDGELNSTVLLDERLEVTFKTSASVSWQNMAKALVKKLGHEKVPEAMIKAHTGKPKESVKIKEVTA